MNHRIAKHPKTADVIPFFYPGGKTLTRQELLETQRDVPVTVFVVSLEDVGHALQHDAALHEEVEAHAAGTALVVGTVEQMDEVGAEPVAKGDEGVGVFGKGDVAAGVRVEAVEEAAPGGEEGPETAVRR